MAINSLFPAFFRLFSVSEFGAHISTHPCRTWSPSGGSIGSFKAWDDSDREAGDMMTDFVDLLLPFFTAETEYTQAIIYTMDDEDAEPLPRGFASFSGKTGTSVAAAVPASQSQYTFRTDNFGLAKLLFFDAPVTTDFLPITSLAASADLLALFNYLKADTNAFCGRDNGQFAQFVRGTFKLNDELRKQYRLA